MSGEFGNVEDGVRNERYGAVGRRHRLLTTGEGLADRRCDRRNEDGDARAAQAAGAAVFAWVGSRTARLLRAGVGHRDGKQVRRLDGERREPQGEEEPSHASRYHAATPHLVRASRGVRNSPKLGRSVRIARRDFRLIDHGTCRACDRIPRALSAVHPGKAASTASCIVPSL